MQFHHPPAGNRATGLQMRATGILLALNQADYVQCTIALYLQIACMVHAIDMLYLIDIIDVAMA
jgi:hypothetical protein